MKTNRPLFLAVLLVAAGALPAAQAQDHPAKTAKPASGNDIVAIASGADDFKTLVTAIEAAGLVETLQGEGPFTVFAPTDEAFAKLPDGALEDLLKPANKAQLAGILACHVVPGKIMAADMKTMKATNVSGQDLHIEVADGVVTVDGAKVIKADIVAGNGVIHVIDTVIIPTAPVEAPETAKPKDHPGH